MNKEIRTSFADIPVTITFKSVKNVNLRIREQDGQVIISAPWGFPLSRIESFVVKKASWIRAKREQVLSSPRALAEHASDEEKRQWRLVVEACVPPLIAEWEPILGVKAKTVVYRNMKSRWGSCQPSTGRICINTRLALYPPECLEYVVVHELCHLLVANHGPEFHRLMGRVMPDWKRRKQLLA